MTDLLPPINLIENILGNQIVLPFLLGVSNCTNFTVLTWYTTQRLIWQDLVGRELCTTITIVCKRNFFFFFSKSLDQNEGKLMDVFKM